MAYIITPSSSSTYLSSCLATCSLFFFFNDTATTEIYTLSLHDALPISEAAAHRCRRPDHPVELPAADARVEDRADRKSTRLNSSHTVISYAVFCVKKKKEYTHPNHIVVTVLIQSPVAPSNFRQRLRLLT